MKKFLLTLATAAFVAGTVSAQLPALKGQKLAAPAKELPALKADVPANLSLLKADTKLQKCILSPANGMMEFATTNNVLRNESAVRDNKTLSYLYDYSAYTDDDDLQLGPLGLSYGTLSNYRWGFASLFTKHTISRLVGNKITSISFIPWMGAYTEGEVYIMDGNLNKLWSKSVDITGVQISGQYFEPQLNTIECDYTITGNEGNYLLIGYSAVTTAAANDPYASSYGIIFPMIEDETDLAAGGYMIYGNQEGTAYRLYGSVSDWQNSDGSVAYYAFPIWATTEGDASINDNDVALSNPNTIRSKGYSGTENVDITLLNTGLTPVSSVDYRYMLLNQSGEPVKQITDTYTFDSPIGYLQYGTLTAKALLPDNLAWGVGDVEVLNVNGVTDQYDGGTDYENVSEFYAYSLGNYPAARRALVEEYTSVGCGYCPRGILGMDALADEYDKNSESELNDVNIITIHADYGNYTDALADDTYSYAFDHYGQSLPSAYINRVENVDPYFGNNSSATSAKEGIVATVASYLNNNPYCEANVGVTSEYDESDGTITVNSTINFLTAPIANEYSIGYVLTESGLTSSQLNSYAGYSQYYDGDLLELCNKSKTYTAEYNYVSRYNTNCQGVDYKTYTYYDAENAKLPASAAGSTITHSAVFNMPSGVDDRSANIVAVLYDNKTKEVVQSTSAWLGSTSAGIDKAQVAPNANIAIADNAFNVTADNATAEVYSTDGKLVSSSTVNGTASLPTFGKGVFVIRVVSGNNVTTRKATF